MSIEEAVELLERSIREGHRMIDEHSLLTDEHGYKEFEDGIKANEAILALLKTHPDNQPNEPLTLEELGRMVGKWVWVEYYGNGPHYEGWAYINDEIWCIYLGQYVPMNLGDRCIKFFRRPPKEET